MTAALPGVSVIVPTFDRPERLARCVAALADLDYPPDSREFLVVDDGSRAALERRLRDMTTSAGGRFLRQAHAGPAAARNLGAAAARHPVLAFTDDDCVPRRDWLRAIGARFRDAPDVAVSGRTVNAVAANPYSATSQQLIDYLQDYYDDPVHGARFATSSNIAFPAADFRALGGFDVAFPRAGGEDRELCDRWVAGGRRILYASDAIVDHHHEMSLGSFLSQNVNYGRGAYGFREARRRRGVGPVRVEPLSFYLGLLKPAAGGAEGSGRASLAVLAQVAHAAGFLAEAVSNRLRNGRPKRDAA